MKKRQLLQPSKAGQAPNPKFLTAARKLIFAVLLLLVAGFFWQSEDETGMYIILAAVVVGVGLVNLLKGFFMKRKRAGAHGHGGETPQQTSHNDGAE